MKIDTERRKRHKNNNQKGKKIAYREGKKWMKRLSISSRNI